MSRFLHDLRGTLNRLARVDNSHLHIIPRFPNDGFGFRFPPDYGKLAERTHLDELAEKIRTGFTSPRP